MSTNTGVNAPPEPQGYELVELAPGQPYDPFGDGTRIYACPECGATWNADDLHDAECSRADLMGLLEQSLRDVAATTGDRP